MLLPVITGTWKQICNLTEQRFSTLTEDWNHLGVLKTTSAQASPPAVVGPERILGVNIT